MRSAGYHEKMIGRTYFGGDQLTQLNLVLYNTIKWPYQPKHSPSCFEVVIMYHSQLQSADLNILVFCVWMYIIIYYNATVFCLITLETWSVFLIGH